MKLQDLQYSLSRLRHPRFLYYKKIFRRRILDTPPAHCDPKSTLEIHTLTCERDYLDLMWCLKTFRHFAGIPFDLVVHDDGTLSGTAMNRLVGHFPGARFIAKPRADAEMRHVLEEFECCRRLREQLPLAKKALDFPHFAARDRFLMLDSDVLFFGPPEQMIQSISEGTMFFMSDYQDAYVHPVARLREMYGVHVQRRFNTGIAFLSRTLFDQQFMEEYCRDLERAGLLGHPWAEQTLIALQVARSGESCERLPSAYAISSRDITPRTVSHHFVNDGSRPRFYSHGLRYLGATGFLKRFRGAALAP